MNLEKYWLKNIAETFNGYFVAIAKNIIRQIKNNLINDDNNSTDNHTHFMEKVFNKLYPNYGKKMHNTERNRTNYKIPQNRKLISVQRDIHIDTENKIPFRKFSTKLHM